MSLTNWSNYSNRSKNSRLNTSSFLSVSTQSHMMVSKPVIMIVILLKTPIGIKSGTIMLYLKSVPSGNRRVVCRLLSTSGFSRSKMFCLLSSMIRMRIIKMIVIQLMVSRFQPILSFLRCRTSRTNQ